MKNKTENHKELNQEQLLAVFGGAPLNFDPDYKNEPLAPRKMGFPDEHGFTTVGNGKVPMPYV
ncbi:hypothetical protein [Glaciecola sp.]|jgi:hypothetical protein|uniref:hypothetical protein n=1 Tax=Glaciecola sp. MF2-115 TaxID=3384827 RepID=UPI0039894D20